MAKLDINLLDINKIIEEMTVGNLVHSSVRKLLENGMENRRRSNFYPFNVVESDAVPADTVFLLPTHLELVRVGEGDDTQIMVMDYEDGDVRQIRPKKPRPLTDEEWKFFGVIKNVKLD